ncbi:MAG: hypothetical protein IKH27_13165 [Oscillospiraceae bacterium]|nr:hypothetical protein [Oscillospiraceae bacterium]
MDLSGFSGLLKNFGVDLDAVQEAINNPETQEQIAACQQELTQNPGFSDMMGKLDGIAAQGGIMPDDIDGMIESLGGMGGISNMLGSMGSLFGAMTGGNDIDSAVSDYEPEAYDAGDRAFVTELKAWLKDTAADIPADGVCMLEIGYHLVFPGEGAENVTGELWLGYNTAQTDADNCANGHADERWNIAFWTANRFRLLDQEPLADWYASQGYDLAELDDEDGLKQRIYDLAAVAVTELHREKFTEQHFGKKIPFIIEDYEYNEKTAVRAVKANGKELFDGAFFAFCGWADA